MGARVFGRRQNVIEVAPPFGRIFAVAVGACRRPVEQHLDARAAAAGGLGFLAPEVVLLQNLQHCRGVDVADRQAADHRQDVAIDRIAEVPPVLFVAPCPVTVGEEAPGGFTHRKQARHGGALDRPRLVALDFGVAAIGEHLAQFGRLLARRGQ